jgi:hypothetical protein
MAESKFLSDLHTVDLPHSQYVMLTKPLAYYSRTLGTVIVVPVGFVTDLESIPLFKGTSKRSGVIHDYLSRFDSKPCVNKRLAAEIYLEAMRARDTELNRECLWCMVRRNVKAFFAFAAWGYFHSLPVGATFSEIMKARPGR